MILFSCLYFYVRGFGWLVLCGMKYGLEWEAQKAAVMFKYNFYVIT
jgi:hypothetical protein